MQPYPQLSEESKQQQQQEATGSAAADSLSSPSPLPLKLPSPKLPPPKLPPPKLPPPNLSSQKLSSKPAFKPVFWEKIPRLPPESIWAKLQKSEETSKIQELFDRDELLRLFPSASITVENTKLLGGGTAKVYLIKEKHAEKCLIILKQYKMPIPQLVKSLIDMDETILDSEKINNLLKFYPSKEEKKLLEDYTGDKTKLGGCEQFMLELLKVPRMDSIMKAFSFKNRFYKEVAHLKGWLTIVNCAAIEIMDSVKLKRIMETILLLGNVLNQGTNRGSALGFRLDSLLKVIDTRTSDNKTTLMHYLCKVLTDKLPEVLNFNKDLVTLEDVSKMQLKFLDEEIEKIIKDLQSVQLDLAYFEGEVPEQLISWKTTMKEFLLVAAIEVQALNAFYSITTDNADALVRYLGDPSRCPFELVILTLLQFTKKFENALEENRKRTEENRKRTGKN